jgi:hypothetical protein
MAEHEVKLIATEGIFRGLAKQNMLFHQCLAELIDNAIAAQKPNQKFRVDVIFNPVNNENATLYVADNCKGMDLELLSKALQLGESATIESRLNEHGFGLKNALATLSSGNGAWKIWSSKDGNKVVSVEGPFQAKMKIKDDDSFPKDDFLSEDISTLIKVNVKISFVQTVQGRGAPSQDLSSLRNWLIEHLGVLYRGFLEQDQQTLDSSGVIVVSINNDRLQVPPVQVPLGNKSVEYIEVELGGIVHKLEYYHGTLDEVKRDKLVRGNKSKYYYQGNQPSQGIDIRLGKRVIATRQFDTVWKTEKGDRQLDRHNNYNDFLGELVIPELPRGILTTTNNKSDFNLEDSDWVKIFQKLNEFRPVKNIRERSEADLKKKWLDMLKATNPDETISDEKHIWPTGTRIDVFRKTPDDRVIVYELKVGSGAPIHLYQLKMYWDGLVLSGELPKEAILLVEDFTTTLEEMANLMNKLTPPNGSKSYNFKIERLKDKGL